MKHLTPTLACVFGVGPVVGGSGPVSKAALRGDSAAELSANDLAELQDFHAWKLPVPPSQQPLKRVELVLVGADRASVPLFGTAYSDPAPAWTNLLLGFRYESG